MSTTGKCPRCGTPLDLSGLGVCPRCVGSFLMGEGSDESSNPISGLRLGRYELVEEIGRGAMGVVFRAHQSDLNRDVAVKVILSGQFASESERRRFLLEAESAGGLDHPNIVPIYEAGEEDNRQFYAMKLVDGRRLSDDPPRSRNPAEAAQLIETLARAVHHAHQRGVIHRDLKPANILIGPDGVPHISDFGLARRLDSDGGLTISGSPLGTPAYMAPEQACGIEAATTSADVYSLGAILYELIAGSPPFSAATVPELLRRIVEEDAPIAPLLEHLPRTQRPLAIICLKCLRKETAQRYSSAAELADDLRAFAEGREISARPATPFERVALWARRRPAVAALSASVVLLLLLVAVGGPVFVFRLATSRANEAKAGIEARSALFEALLNQARALKGSLEPGRRINGLNAVRSAAKIRVTPELRNDAIALLALIDHEQPTNTFKHLYQGQGTAVSPDFTLFASPERDGTIRMSRKSDSSVLFRWHAPQSNIFSKATEFSADGRWLAIFSQPSDWFILNATNGSAVLATHQSWFASFSPDSKWASVILQDHEVCVYDLETGKLAAKRHMPGGIKGHTAFHPDATVHALAFLDGNRIAIWDWDRDLILDEIQQDGNSTCVAWAGDILATGFEDGSLRLWNLRSRRMKITRGHQGVLNTVLFSQNPRWLVSHGYDGVAIWWDTTSGNSSLVDGDLYPIAFRNDNGAVALENFVGYTQVPVHIPASHRVLYSPDSTRLTFSPDGRWLVSWGNRILEIFDFKSGNRLFSQPRQNLVQVMFMPDGESLLLEDRDRITRNKLSVTRTGIVFGAAETLYTRPPGDLEGVGLTRDAKGILISGGVDHLAMMDFDAPGRMKTLAGAVIPRSPILSHDGRWLVTCTFHGFGPQIWDLVSNTPPILLHTGNSTVGFDPSGKRMYSAVSDKLAIFETGTWKLIHKQLTYSGTSLPDAADWSPNGELLAFIRRRNEVVLLETSSWKESATLTSPDTVSLSAVVFHPGGKALASMTNEGRIEIWDLEGLVRELADLGIPWQPPFNGTTLPKTPSELIGVGPMLEQSAMPRRAGR